MFLMYLAWYNKSIIYILKIALIRGGSIHTRRVCRLSLNDLQLKKQQKHNTGL